MGGAVKSIVKSVTNPFSAILGGSSGGGVQQAISVPTTTSTSLGGTTKGAEVTADEDKRKLNPLQKKKQGTSGVQIPLVSNNTAPSAGGIQV